MVQNDGEIGVVDSVRWDCDLLHRPSLITDSVNVDRSRVGFVRIDNVDGVIKLTPERVAIEHTKEQMKAHT